jgi:hypothetical protein
LPKEILDQYRGISIEPQDELSLAEIVPATELRHKTPDSTADHDINSHTAKCCKRRFHESQSKAGLGMEDRCHWHAPQFLSWRQICVPVSRRAALESLERAIEEHGQRVPDGTQSFPNGAMIVPPDTWRDCYHADCRARESKVADDTLSKRFWRAVRELTESNQVGRIGEWNWIVQPEVTLQ